MLIDRINNWFNLSKQFFFTYSDGFFNLTYLANSPETMVKSFEKMPFMKKDIEKQLLYADTPFVKGVFCFVELEPGLWIMNSEMNYKNNVSYKPIYDKISPPDYYTLTINLVENKFKNDFFKTNDFIINHRSISFLKPEEDFLHSHFKGSKESKYILYFDQEWVDNHIINSSVVNKEVKDLFLNTEKGYLNYTYDDESLQILIKRLKECFDTSAKPNVFGLKKLAYDYLSLFFESLKVGNNFNSHELALKDKLKIQKIEHYLVSNLYKKFVGIDYLAAKCKMSPTKLKKNFKLLYGVPIFQYYQDQKMRLALSYLESGEMKIKDIAKKLDYENVSKFTKAFKKYYNQLPSQVK